MNFPVGLFVDSVFRLNDFDVDIKLGWFNNDFDEDISGFMVDIQSSAFLSGVGGLTDSLLINAVYESPVSTISSDSILTEQNLDWSEIDVTLTNETVVIFKKRRNFPLLLETMNRLQGCKYSWPGIKKLK